MRVLTAQEARSQEQGVGKPGPPATPWRADNLSSPCPPTACLCLLLLRRHESHWVRTRLCPHFTITTSLKVLVFSKVLGVRTQWLSFGDTIQPNRGWSGPRQAGDQLRMISDVRKQGEEDTWRSGGPHLDLGSPWGPQPALDDFPGTQSNICSTQTGQHTDWETPRSPESPGHL